MTTGEMKVKERDQNLFFKRRGGPFKVDKMGLDPRILKAKIVVHLSPKSSSFPQRIIEESFFNGRRNITIDLHFQ